MIHILDDFDDYDDHADDQVDHNDLAGEVTLQADSASRSSMTGLRNTSEAWKCCLRVPIILSPGEHDDDDDEDHHDIQNDHQNHHAKDHHDNHNHSHHKRVKVTISVITVIMTMMSRVTERSGGSVDFTSTHEFRASLPSSSSS